MACTLGPHDNTTFAWPAAAERPPVPPSLRRRVSIPGQAALRAAWAMPSVDQARFVFASRHGEFERTLAMLNSLAAGEPPSPADFSLGVHNALAGLLSVATRNRAGHTALAAGIDSFGFGLMEAAAGLADHSDQRVVLVYHDAGPPDGYPDTVPPEAEAHLALALALAPPDVAPRRFVMTAEPTAVPPGEAAAAVFLRFLRDQPAEASAAGESMRWTWRHV